MIKAIILAGGLGTRLRSVTDLPKPIIDVGGKPFLFHIIDHLKKFSIIKEIIISIGYKGELIKRTMGSKFLYCDEGDAKLGTAGAVSKVIKENSLFFEDFLLINGDTFLDIDVNQLIKFHKEKESDLTLSLTKVEDTSRFGRIEVDKNNKIITIEKGISGPGLINGGYYLFNSNALAYFIKRGSLESEVIPFIDDKFGFIVEGMFIDMGIPEDLERARKIFYG